MPGPQKLPSEIKKLRGTFRPHRDGPENHSMDDLSSENVERPTDLTGEAAKLWDQLIPSMQLIKVVRDVDIPFAAGMCRWFALWRELDQKLQSLHLRDGSFETVDEEIEYERYTASVQRRASNAWRNFAQAAAKLGFTPADRARLRSNVNDGEGEPRDTSDPLSYFGIN